jgi:hypothetical protein
VGLRDRSSAEQLTWRVRSSEGRAPGPVRTQAAIFVTLSSCPGALNCEQPIRRGEFGDARADVNADAGHPADTLVELGKRDCIEALSTPFAESDDVPERRLSRYRWWSPDDAATGAVPV